MGNKHEPVKSLWFYHDAPHCVNVQSELRKALALNRVRWLQKPRTICLGRFHYSLEFWDVGSYGVATWCLMDSGRFLAKIHGVKSITLFCHKTTQCSQKECSKKDQEHSECGDASLPWCLSDLLVSRSSTTRPGLTTNLASERHAFNYWGMRRGRDQKPDMTLSITLSRTLRYSIVNEKQKNKP